MLHGRRRLILSLLAIVLATDPFLPSSRIPWTLTFVATHEPFHALSRRSQDSSPSIASARGSRHLVAWLLISLLLFLLQLTTIQVLDRLDLYLD